MEPDIQRLVITTLVGLLLLFPVFNQVAASSLEALKDADHKAKWKDFFKDWGDIPEDEKLAYWDGRNKPPGADGDFDSDRVDDDGRFADPGGDGGDGSDSDRDGDGVPDDRDEDPDDPTVGGAPEYRWAEKVLWSFVGGDQVTSNPGESLDDGTSYEYVNVTWSYDGFNGKAAFTMYVDGAVAWDDIRESTAQDVYTVAASDDSGKSIAQVGTAALTMEYDYEPLGPPNEFQITVTGAYKSYDGT